MRRPDVTSRVDHLPARPRLYGLYTLTLLAFVGWLALNWPHQGLWYDEALTAWLATGSWQQLIEWCTRTDIQVPLHYIVLNGFTMIGGSSEFTLHLLSAFCALLTVAAVIALVRRLLDPSPAIITAALLAFTPGFLWIAYEIRAYALALALFAWASVILMALLKPGKPRLWLMVAYCALSLAMLYTHYTGIAALAAHGVIIAWTAWRNRSYAAPLLRRIAICAVIIGIGFAPWLPVLLSRGTTDRSYYPGAIQPQETLGVIFSFKWLARDDFRWLTPDQTISPLALIVAAGIVLFMGGIVLWIVRRGAARPLIYGLAMALLPALMFTIVVYFRPKLAGRYAWPAWIGIDLLLTCGLDALASWLARPKPTRRIVLVGLVGVLVFVAVPWATGQTGHPPDSDFRGAFAYVHDHRRDDDLVILRDGTLFPVAEYYHSPPYIGLPESLITDTSHILHAQEAVSVLTSDRLSATRGVWLLAWQGDVMDPENMTSALLETVGTRQPIRETFGEVSLDYFSLNRPLSTIQSPQINADPLVMTPDGLTLRSAALVTAGPLYPGDSLVAHSWWQRDGVGNGVTRVSIRLFGPDGKIYGQVDQPPAGWFYLSNHWPQSTPILGRYEMRLPADSPSSITMKLVVYSAANVMSPAEITVGTVQVVAP